MQVFDTNLCNWRYLKVTPKHSLVKADLHGTTVLHFTSLQQAYDMNCFLWIKPTTRLRFSFRSQVMSQACHKLVVCDKVVPCKLAFRCLYHPSASFLRAAKRNPSKNTNGWLSCHGHAILLITVENNWRHTRVTVHDKLSILFSFQGK